MYTVIRMGGSDGYRGFINSETLMNVMIMIGVYIKYCFLLLDLTTHVLEFKPV